MNLDDMDFRDKLDAEAALRLARSHGDSNSILSFRDRLDANLLVRPYNQTQAAINQYRRKVGDTQEEMLEPCD